MLLTLVSRILFIEIFLGISVAMDISLLNNFKIRFEPTLSLIFFVVINVPLISRVEEKFFISCSIILPLINELFWFPLLK